jgi:hypothetical protein
MATQGLIADADGDIPAVVYSGGAARGGLMPEREATFRSSHRMP